MRMSPRINLFRDGYVHCAASVIATQKRLGQMVYVYIDPDGGVFCNTQRYGTRAPTHELVGCYTGIALARHIEDDLRAWIDERIKQRAQGATTPQPGDGRVLVQRHWIENVGYAASMLENSESRIDQLQAPALRKLIAEMAAAPSAKGVANG